MPSQRSLFSSYQVLFVVAILNIFSFLHCVNGNNQTLVIPFPPELPAPGFPNEKLVRLRMDGAIPAESNTLICTGYTLNTGDQFWIKQINPVVTQTDIAMNLYACDTPQVNPCSCALPNRTLLYSWYRYTPPFRFQTTFFPTGYNVGGDSQIRKLFVEVRYGNTRPNPDTANGFDIQITRIRPYYMASLYSVLVRYPAGTNSTPPNQSNFTLETCVPVPSNHPNVVRMLAFRTNSQTRGKLLSGYLRNSTTGVITELGRGNPAHPQAFIVPTKSHQLNPGDLIMLRCILDSVNGFVGSTQASVACIFNIMFITPYFVPAFTKSSFLSGSCTAEQSALFPSSSRELIPENPKLIMHALYGNQSGIVQVGPYSINLDMENFLSIYP